MGEEVAGSVEIARCQGCGLPLSWPLAHNGCVNLPVVVPPVEEAKCPSCRGAGRVIDVYAADDASSRRCGYCFGSGVQPTLSPGQPAHLPTAEDQGDGSGVGA